MARHPSVFEIRERTFSAWSTRAVLLSATIVVAAHSSCGGTPANVQRFPPGGACSELAGDIYTQEVNGDQACASAPVLERELISVGGGFVIDWNHESNQVRLWSVSAAGGPPLGSAALRTSADGALDSASVLFPLGGLEVLSVLPRDNDYRVAPIVTAPGAGNPVDIPPVMPGQTPQGLFTWPDPEEAFWGHELVALDDDYLLKWWEGTGDYVVLQYERQQQTAPIAVTAFAGNNAALRRGARILNLGGGRLLEWIPVTGAYRIWAYHLDGSAGSIFDPTPVSEGQWADPGPGDELLIVDLPDGPGGKGLLLWERATGRVRLRVLDPMSPDPMAGALVAETTYAELQSASWEAPTQSTIANAVIILQSGRSFDAYFGQYCQAPFGSIPTCNLGPTCCDAMPAATPGAAACTPLDATVDEYVPDQSVACMLSKIDGGRMDGFASAGPAGCGDARAVSCAGTGAAAGPVATYQAYAASGALADRFFQSTLDPTPIANLAYLSQVSYQPPVKPQQLSSLMANARVRWALYIDDPTQVLTTYGYLPPGFYDPRWTFFRAPSEFQRDLDLEQLPAISIVLPTNGETETPGSGPAANGISFVQGIVGAISSSERYAATTLVLVAYLTSGGFYDHVTPPPGPAPVIDSASGAVASAAGTVFYGPRVPLLALGPFARKNYVSHVPLELSSLTVFLEWNWLGENSVGALGGRDLTAANIGSLLDPAATGSPAVPEVPLLAYPPGLVWSNGFEGADANAWAEKMGLSEVKTDGNARTGRSYGQLTAGGGVSSFQALVPVIDGYGCSVEAWILSSPTLAGGSMQVADGTTTASVAVSPEPSGPAAYLPYTVPFTGSGTNATVLFSLAGNPQSVEFMDVDDVAVTCMPAYNQQ